MRRRESRLFAASIDSLRVNRDFLRGVMEKREVLRGDLRVLRTRYEVYLEAQKLLTALSDKNTNDILNYIMGVINRALHELYPHDGSYVKVEHTMYREQYPHINLTLVSPSGALLDLEDQTGTGVRQTISYLFTLSLIVLCRGRQLIVMDELLSGVHPVAKNLMVEIIKIFASDGMQFIMVEYGLDNLGLCYLVEKPGDTAYVTRLDGEYNNEVFVAHKPPEYYE